MTLYTQSTFLPDLTSVAMVDVLFLFPCSFQMRVIYTLILLADNTSLKPTIPVMVFGK